MLLFLPKILSIVLVLRRPEGARPYGGIVRLATSVVLEIVLSSLLAPIRMVFHSRFVVLNLLGRTVTWRSQEREDAETGWREALRQHGFDTLWASAWGAALLWLNPHYFWWVTPIIGALILAVPVSTITSRVRAGERARRWGLFLIPEESAPPRELRDLAHYLAEARRAAAAIPAVERDGFVRVAVDPYTNALHRALLGRERTAGGRLRATRRALLERALRDGPAGFPARERRALLLDPGLTDELHRRVWALPSERAARWGRPAAAPPAEP
jgi:membrane glycosyltransferase